MGSFVLEFDMNIKGVMFSSGGETVFIKVMKLNHISKARRSKRQRALLAFNAEKDLTRSDLRSFSRASRIRVLDPSEWWRKTR